MDNENTNTELATQGQETQEVQTYSKEEVNAMLQREADRRVSSALEKQKKEYEKKLSLSTLDENQRAVAEKENRIGELEEQLKEFRTIQAKNEMIKVLDARGLSPQFADLIAVDDDVEAAQERIDALDSLIKANIVITITYEVAYTACTAPASVNKVTHNSKPKVKVLIAAEPDGQAQSIYCAIDGGSYQKLADVSSVGGTFVFALPQLTAGAHSFTLRTTDGLANSAETGVVALNYVVPVFTDENPIEVKAAHITEARSYINNMREYSGFAPITWGENITANSTLVKASHWTELQDAIAAVNPQTYTAVKKGDSIKKAVLTQIRTAIIGG